MEHGQEISRQQNLEHCSRPETSREAGHEGRGHEAPNKNDKINGMLEMQQAHIAPEHCARATPPQINAKGEDTNGEKKSNAQQHTLTPITIKALFGMIPTLGGAAPLQNFRWSQLWVELELSDEGVWLGGCLQLQKR